MMTNRLLRQGIAVPQGVADEEEFIPSINKQLQCEDEEVEQLDDEDDSDDKPMPQEWTSNDFGHLAIRQGATGLQRE
jgi:hypothetical protein